LGDLARRVRANNARRAIYFAALRAIDREAEIPWLAWTAEFDSAVQRDAPRERRARRVATAIAIRGDA
jgi:hypothetical protein